VGPVAIDGHRGGALAHAIHSHRAGDEADAMAVVDVKVAVRAVVEALPCDRAVVRH